MPRRRLVKIFLWAALFRLLFLLWSWTPWLAEEQSGMSRLYFRQGYGLAAGYGYVSSTGKGGAALKTLYDQVNIQRIPARPVTAPALPNDGVYYETLHPPGMAALIAGWHMASGKPADVFMQIFGLLEDSAAAVLLAWLVAQALGPDVGYATGLIYAFFPPLANESAAARTPEGLMSLFVIGTLACVWMALVRQPRRWLPWALAAGLVLGVGSYLRPDYILLPVALGAGAWAMTRRFWLSFRGLVVVQLMALVVLLPWAWRNHALCGRWIFTSTSVGPTLITGLGEYRNPWGFGATDTDRDKEAAAQGFVSAWSPEADAYFRKLFLQSIREKPLGYVESVVKRIPLAVAPPLDFGFANPAKQESFSQLRARTGTDRYGALRTSLVHTLAAYADVLAMAAVCLAALLASAYMLWCERARWGLVIFLLMPHLYSIGSHLLAHFEPRFLLPSIGCLLIGLGYVAARLRGSIDRP
jgi:4-amino-4-deoxy-L-arabinose transferase-like glycosyltransferase